MFREQMVAGASRSAAVFAGICAFAACDPLALLRPFDGGVIQHEAGPGSNIRDGGSKDADAFEDAGFDGGPSGRPTDDAGWLDGGREDAGPEDGGPPPCSTDMPAQPYACEPDADFCDPLGDALVPQVDLVQAWSRIEGGAFILEVRFAAPPFTSWTYHDVHLGVEDDGDDATDDVAFGVDLAGELTVVWVDWALNLANHQGNGFSYPPSFFTGVQGDNAYWQRSPCDEVAVSADGFMLRFVLAGEEPYELPLRYVVSADHPGDAWGGQDYPPIPRDALVQSRGGAADVVDFVGICEATCPIDADGGS